MASATQDFKVRISAQDDTSGTLAAINKRMANINKEVARARKPFDDLAANAKKFASVTGIDKIASGMGNVARAGFDAFRSVARIVEPLAAITGAASIAGMMKLATAWADFGTNLGNASARAGVTVNQMMELQNAGRLAGVSAEGVSSAMVHLHDSMVDAMGGRAPQVIKMMNALFGPDAAMGKIKQFAQDGAKALPELSDKIAGLTDPTLRALAGTTLLGGSFEQITPFIRKGSAGIAEYTARAQKYGLMNDDAVVAANRLREAQTDLTLAVEGFGNSVAQAVAPVLGPLLQQMADWIAANRTWIAQDIGDKVREFVKWLQSPAVSDFGNKILTVTHWVSELVTALGGVIPVGEEIAAFYLGAKFTRAMAVMATGARGLTGASGSLLGDFAVGAVPALELGAVALADHFAGDQPSNDDVRSSHPTWLGRWMYDQSSALRGLDNSLHPRNLRNNNPTNLSFAGQPGATTDGRFARFPTMEAGVAADLNQLLLYQDRDHLMTVRAMVNRATPESDNPGVAGYIDRVAKALRTSPDAPINLHDPAVASQYISAVAAAEGSMPSSTSVQRGVNQRLGIADPMAATGPALTLPANAGTAAAPGGAGVMPNGQVQVGVNVNAPAGTTTTAVQSGQGMAPLKVARSTVGYANGMLGAA